MAKLWYLILPTIMFLVSLFDLGTTLYCSRNISNFEEANPIARCVWQDHGDTGFIIFKLCFTLPSCFCVGYVLKYKNRRWQLATSVFGLTTCTFLVAWWIFWLFF